MRATFEKLLFVAVVVLVTATGARMGSAGRVSGIVARSFPSGSPEKKAIPLFVLGGPSPSSSFAVPALWGSPGPSSSAERGALVGDPVPLIPPFVKKSSLVPEVRAAIASVVDLRTGEVYFGKGMKRQWPIASLTKLVSAVEATKGMDGSQPITLLPEEFLLADNSVLKNLKVGDTYRVSDLVRAMLAVSSNEAAEALATAYGRANFVAEMNAVAREWGLGSTNFADPTGLSPANQSTAEDLAKVTERLFGEYPDLLAITREPEVTITEVTSGVRRVLKNINLFSGKPGFLGGKTGYTDEAGGNLLTVWSIHDRPVLFLVMGSEDRFGETGTLLDWFFHVFEPSR